MPALDENFLAYQIMMLVAYLPTLIALAVTGGWALLRLHLRLRAGWLMLGIVALTAIQIGGLSTLWSLLIGSFGGLGAVVTSYLMMALYYGLEIAGFWLMLLGFFGPHPFRKPDGNSSSDVAEDFQ